MYRKVPFDDQLRRSSKMAAMAAILDFAFRRLQDKRLGHSGHGYSKRFYHGVEKMHSFASLMMNNHHFYSILSADNSTPNNELWG
jgi:hypothetical protein